MRSERGTTMPARTPTEDRLNAEINVTPMADIMLVLLIIFMITAPLLQGDVFVNLPKAKNPLDAQGQGAATVVLTRDGRIYLGRTAVTEDELYRTLSERLSGEIDRNVFVKADVTLAYGRVVHLVNQCRKLGVERIGLMTEKQTDAVQ